MRIYKMLFFFLAPKGIVKTFLVWYVFGLLVVFPISVLLSLLGFNGLERGDPFYEETISVIILIIIFPYTSYLLFIRPFIRQRLYNWFQKKSDEELFNSLKKYLNKEFNNLNQIDESSKNKTRLEEMKEKAQAHFINNLNDSDIANEASKYLIDKIEKKYTELGFVHFRSEWITANEKTGVLKKERIKEEFEKKQREKKVELEKLIEKFEKKQRDKGLEFYEGKWLPLKEFNRLKEIEIGLENNFENYSPFEFEEFIAKLFSAMGYKTEVTSKTGDYGIDVIARRKNEIVAIQAKHFKEGTNVGNRDVQRLLGSMRLKNIRATHGILITTTYFTLQAKVQAEETNVELWDQDTLYSMVRKFLL